MKATNSATLIYGDTGTGKTSLLATAAEYAWNKYKKKTRYYAGDLGGYGDGMLALQSAGIVEVWRFQSRDPDGTKGLAIGTCALATQGYWPKEGTWDPETGLSEVGGELVAPSSNWFVMYCKNGHVAKRVQAQTLLVPGPCPTCKAVASKESCGRVEKSVVINPDWAEVGAVVYDSLTAMGEWGMTEMNYRASQGTLGGIKGALSTVVSSGVSFGSAGMSAVGFMQGRVQDWPRNAVNIPGLVLPPIFTALEQKGTDDSSIPLYGPNIPGKAKTADVSSWFGNTLGTVTVNEGGVNVHRLYLETYTTDKDAVPHRCKSRVSPGVLPAYLQDPEGATVENKQSFTVFSLGHFFSLLHSAQEEAEKVVREKYKDAPGMKGKVEIGKGVGKEEEGVAVEVEEAVEVVEVVAVAAKEEVKKEEVKEKKEKAVEVTTAVVKQATGEAVKVTPVHKPPTIVRPPVSITGTRPKGVIPRPGIAGGGVSK